jgi:multidrug transporter EmrE-like cation transporter
MLDDTDPWLTRAFRAGRPVPANTTLQEERRMPEPLDPERLLRAQSHEAMPPSVHHETERRPDQGEAPRRTHLTIGNLALLLFAVGAAAAGQVMLRHGMQIASARAADTRGSLAFAAATSPWVLLGLMVFAVSATAWLVTLSRVPLSVAYPFNALGYLAILTVSVLVLHERANVWTWVGSLLVVSGLIIVVLTRP